jgi:hypothetical protein
MPTSLPSRARAKPAPKRKPAQKNAEGLEIWAISVGLGAIVLASFIYFSSGEQVVTSLVLVSAAVVVAAMWRASIDDIQSER